MIIVNEKKLGFSDVLIQPKRSELSSRKDVDLRRTMTFRNGTTWFGIPIMASNMDSVGTLDAARAMAEQDMFTCLHKFLKIEDIFAADLNPDTFAITIGIDDIGITNLGMIYERDKFEFICVDVANGYTERFSEFIKRMRGAFSDKTIIAGNVCTPEMTQQLLLDGADIVKVGIGPGCFIRGTEVKTENGYKNIEDIEIGDSVLTHKGQYEKVVNLFQKNTDELININDEIYCTPNHEFFVVNKKFEDVVNIENYLDYAVWINAENLTDEYLLLELESIKLNLKEITIYDKIKMNSVEVYDLTVENNHSYCVSLNSVIVHNSQCTTRKQTGVGYPQLSAIIECADAAHGLGGHIIADGGCKTPGDVAKAFGGGADFVMLGSMLAAHDENSEFDAQGKAKVYGMSSTEAMNKYYGKVDDYRTTEGRISSVVGRGPLKATLQDILGGLRSTCTYTGSKSIKDLPKCTTFIVTNEQYSTEYENQTIGY
jgi:IMP dehydrogenase/GMP reductase